MNRKNTPKQSPAYPLEHTYPTVLGYWQQQIALGRVELGKVEAMHELIVAGAKALGVTISDFSPKPKRAKKQSALTAPARSQAL